MNCISRFQVYNHIAALPSLLPGIADASRIQYPYSVHIFTGRHMCMAEEDNVTGVVPRRLRQKVIGRGYHVAVSMGEKNPMAADFYDLLSGILIGVIVTVSGNDIAGTGKQRLDCSRRFLAVPKMESGIKRFFLCDGPEDPSSRPCESLTSSSFTTPLPSCLFCSLYSFSEAIFMEFVIRAVSKGLSFFLNHICAAPAFAAFSLCSAPCHSMKQSSFLPYIRFHASLFSSLASTWRMAFNAFPRWLISFFFSGGSCADVQPYSGR